MSLSTKCSQVSREKLNEISIHLGPEIRRVNQVVGTQYTTRYASINCPSDARMLEKVQGLVKELQARNFSAVVLIGIGGSNLGTLAILQALYGKNYQEKATKKFYCADTVDTFNIRQLLKTCKELLEKGQKVLVIVVSKSGGTTETIANAAIFIDLLKQYDPEHYNRSIVAITDHDSSLWFTAKAENWAVLEIPMLVGGRYSVFSPVGLFPLAMVGVDINALQEGAHFMREQCVLENIEENPAARSAIFLFDQYAAKKNIHDTFLFSDRLEGVGKWYRQLMGESLGKRSEGGVLVGITPTVSIGSTDLHSMAQLYLGGPSDKMTSFVWVEDEGDSVIIPQTFLTDERSRQAYLQGKTLDQVMKAIFEGTQQAFEQAEHPFVTISMPKITEQTVAAFLQMKMIEIIYLGYLLEVNSFDQPDVEKYKNITRELLA